MLNYSYPLYRPPSEAKSLILQITEGCSYNKCSFCGMYIKKRFALKPVDEIKREIDTLPETLRRGVRRIFLADGDAAIYPTEGLLEILDHINSRFPELERVSSYAGPSAILQKSTEEWEALKNKKLTLLYFGLESGNSDVLKIMNKNMDAEEIKPKVKQIQQTGIRFSVTAILGGGGLKFSKQHALDTARWISDVNPAYFGLLTIFLKRKKNYFENIGTPTIGDLLNEAFLLVESINTKGMVFRSNHISNMFILRGTLSEEKHEVLNQLKTAEKILTESGLMDAYPDYYAEGFSG